MTEALTKFLTPEDWQMIEAEPLMVHTLDAEALVNTMLALREHAYQTVVDDLIRRHVSDGADRG